MSDVSVCFPFGETKRLLFMRMLVRQQKKGMNFAYCLNNARKGAVPVPLSFKDEYILRYKNNLIKPTPESKVDLVSVGRVIRDWKPISFKEIVEASAQCLSTSACAEQHKLGQVGQIWSWAPHVDLKLNLSQTYKGICPVPYFMYGFIPSTVKGVGNFLPEPLKIRGITTQNSEELAAGKPYQVCLAKRMKDEPNLLFGRTVTKQDVNNLTRRSIEYWGARGYKPQELEYFSADYESATDGISPETSRIIDLFCYERGLLPEIEIPSNINLLSVWTFMARVLEYLPNEGPNFSKRNWLRINTWIQCVLSSYICVKSSEVRSLLWKNREVKIQGDTVIQTHGQMMGDIKSFPILCILNLSLWDKVCDNADVMVTRNSFLGSTRFKAKPPCLVNGDDFLSFAPSKYHDKMIALSKDFDFTLSLGKSYRSKNYAVINSRAFYSKRFNSVKRVKEIPLCHLPIIFRPPDDTPLWQNFNTVCLPYENDHKSLKEVYNLFLKCNKKTILKQLPGAVRKRVSPGEESPNSAGQCAG